MAFKSPATVRSRYASMSSTWPTRFTKFATERVLESLRLSTDRDAGSSADWRGSSEPGGRSATPSTQRLSRTVRPAGCGRPPTISSSTCSWSSRDGSTSFITLDPRYDALEFVIVERAGTPALVLSDGQH